MYNWSLAKATKVANAIRLVNSILNFIGIEVTLNLEGNFKITRI